MVPRNSTAGGFAYIWQKKWVGIIVIKTERRQIHFLSDLFAAIASLDLTVAIIIIADITVMVFIIIIIIGIILPSFSSQLSCRVIISSSPLSLFRYRYCLSLLISVSDRILWRLSFPTVQGSSCSGYFLRKL